MIFLLNVLSSILICLGIFFLFLAWRIFKGSDQGFKEIKTIEDATEYLETGRVFPHDDYSVVKHLGKQHEDD